MKRFMITTALVAGMSTAAFAQDGNIEASVDQYFTAQGLEYSASALTEDQLDAVYQIVTSTESPADQQAKIEAIHGLHGVPLPKPAAREARGEEIGFSTHMAILKATIKRIP